MKLNMNCFWSFQKKKSMLCKNMQAENALLQKSMRRETEAQTSESKQQHMQMFDINANYRSDLTAVNLCTLM